MNNLVGILTLAGVLAHAQMASARESGKALFQEHCAACHSIGGGRLVGPDLAGVSNRYSETWLLKFTKSSQALVQSGDPKALALLDEYKMDMPDQALSDEQIRKILAYIRKSEGKSDAPANTTSKTIESTSDEIRQGQFLFQGRLRFANAGPSCISCHNNDAVFGGGNLASDLTGVFSRLGEPGLRAILADSPFPAMTVAYEGRPLEDDEIRALIGFLQHADKEDLHQSPWKYGWIMLGVGMGGVGVLLGFYSLMWRRRKRKSVNQDIYDRQIKSE